MTYVDTDNAQIDASTVLLSAKVSGFVKTINVKEGDLVKEGTVLLEIDNRDYVNTLNQIKGDLASLEAKRKDAEKNYSRLSELYKKEAVSTQQFDQSKALFNELKSKYDSLAAQVNQAELNLENTKITAPTAGFIAKKSAEVGQLSAPGVPLFGFVDAKERSIVANFKETDVEFVKVGAKVKIDVDAIPSKTFEGVVESLSSATGATFTLLPPDNATGNFTKVVQRIPVRIKFVNLTTEDITLLRAGLSANVKVRK
jgi:membrane fusion protein (multidrug efflux system)